MAATFRDDDDVEFRELVVESWLSSQVSPPGSPVIRDPLRLSGRNMPGCESCSECAAFEFQPENVAPIYNIKAHFVKSQWNIPWFAYLVYRVLAASLLSGWIIGDFVDEAGQFYRDNYALWLIFATNWSFILLGICSVMQAVLVSLHFIRARQNATYEAKLEDTRNSIDLAMMIFWVLYNCAFNGALLVTLSYWGYLFSSENAGFMVTRMSHMKHTLNGVYVLLDMSITAVPIRVFHVVYPLACGVLYTVFNISYFASDGVGPDGKHYAYTVLDWKHPLTSAAACGVAFLLTAIVQGMLYGFYRLRTYVCGHVMPNSYDAVALESERSLLPDVDDVVSESEVESILTPDGLTNSGYEAMGESALVSLEGIIVNDNQNGCDKSPAGTQVVDHNELKKS